MESKSLTLSHKDTKTNTMARAERSAAGHCREDAIRMMARGNSMDLAEARTMTTT
jgi:hypothetical protein